MRTSETPEQILAGRGPHPAGSGRLPMDPRIRQRRIELRRSTGRRRLHVLMAGLAIAASLGGAVALLHSPVLAVRHIALTGGGPVSVSEVAAATGVGPTTPLVDVSPVRAEAALDRLPWVASSVVRRSWPGTLEVSLVERRPVAQVRAPGGRWSELDATGRVLDTSSSAWPDMVTLTAAGTPGPAGSVLVGAGPALAVAAAMPPSVTPQVAAVLGQPGGQVEIRLKGGGTVAVGSPDGAQAKLEALATVLAQTDLSGVKVINVEVPDEPTLTRS